MQRLFSLLLFFGLLLNGAASLERELAKTYAIWQQSMVKKDFRTWDAITASEKKKMIRNKIHSEKFSYPKAVFNTPFLPPGLKQLKLLQAKSSGVNAKAIFFGKIDFGVGGKPTENLMVVSYVNEGRWKFGAAEYVNLSALPDVRDDLLAGKLGYLTQADFLPVEIKSPNPLTLKGSVPIITKVYAYCPGREVRAKVNKISNHLFQNTKEAEIIIGGGQAGPNEIQIAVKKLPGGEGKEPLCVRVYAFSQVQGVQPIKVFEYLVNEGGAVKGVQTARFTIDREMIKTLAGK